MRVRMTQTFVLEIPSPAIQADYPAPIQQVDVISCGGSMDRRADSRSDNDPIDAARREVATKADRRDRHMQYSHEMSYDTGETSARALIRTVPLVYGALLGGLVGNLLLGLVIGLLLTFGLDSRMGDKSMGRKLFGVVTGALCPLVAAFGRTLQWMRVPLPTFLREPGCGGA